MHVFMKGFPAPSPLEEQILSAYRLYAMILRGEDRQEIFPPEVTGAHKEIFAWENVAPEICE